MLCYDYYHQYYYQYHQTEGNLRLSKRCCRNFGSTWIWWCVFSMCGFRHFDRLWCIQLHGQSVFWECLTLTVKAVFHKLLTRRHCVIYSGIWSFNINTNSNRIVNSLSLSLTYWPCEETITACFIIKTSLVFSKIIFRVCISLSLIYAFQYWL